VPNEKYIVNVFHLLEKSFEFIAMLLIFALREFLSRLNNFFIHLREAIDLLSMIDI